MPVEIKELVIRAVLESSASSSMSEANRPVSSDLDAQELIAACVDQVVKILDKRKER